MNIVVLGAGTVGTSIAELLCQQDHSVTVVDSDPVKTKRLNADLDVRVLTGSASQSSVLFQAGISSADVCLAVTGNDEVNIVSASMAKAMGARRTVARIYAPVFHDLSTFDYQRHFRIDRLLSLEHLTALELARGIRDPGSIFVDQFSRGDLQAIDLVVSGGKATSHPLRELDLPTNVRVGTVSRKNRLWIAAADDQLIEGDRITVFTRPEHAKAVKAFFGGQATPTKRVVIAGGGETGLHLARMTEREGHTVMVLESNEERCRTLASALDSALVIHCDATRRVNLEEERVGKADVFVACTGDDEDNIMLCVEARDLGVERMMAVIGRPDYASVMGKLGIDLAVSEREVAARQILSYLTRGIEISRTKLAGGLAIVVELEVAAGSAATASTLRDLPLPPRCLVVAMIQDGYVRVPSGNDQFRAGDTAILLLEEDTIDAALTQFAPAS